MIGLIFKMSGLSSICKNMFIQHTVGNKGKIIYSAVFPSREVYTSTTNAMCNDG
jgi:hypothetical protein